MSLSGYVPATREIAIDGANSFAVKGLALNHLAVLIREHFPDLDGIWTLVANAHSLDGDQFMNVALAVVSQAPGLAANVIALAAGEGSAKEAEALPVGVQLNALVAIIELTFTEPGSVGKSLGTVARLLSMMKATGLANPMMSGR